MTNLIVLCAWQLSHLFFSWQPWLWRTSHGWCRQVTVWRSGTRPPWRWWSSSTLTVQHIQWLKCAGAAAVSSLIVKSIYFQHHTCPREMPVCLRHDNVCSIL